MGYNQINRGLPPAGIISNPFSFAAWAGCLFLYIRLQLHNSPAYSFGPSDLLLLCVRFQYFFAFRVKPHMDWGPLWI